MEHITEPYLFIEKIYNSLSKNGILHIDVPNNDSLSGIASLMIEKNATRYKAITYPQHCFAYNKYSLRYLLEIFFSNIEIFSSSSTSLTYGQTLELSNMQKSFFNFSNLIGKGNLLIGIAQK